MKKAIIIIAVAVLSIMNANAQLNIRKSENDLKQVETLSIYQLWIYQDSKGYYLAANTTNQFDENFFWLPLGSNKAECLESIDGLISIANDTDGNSYYVEDKFGEDLHLFGAKSIMGKILFISDTGHRYAGDAQISIIYLNKARKWFENNLGEITVSFGKIQRKEVSQERPTILSDVANHGSIEKISEICNGCTLEDKQALREIGAVYAKIDSPTPEMEIPLFVIGYGVKKVHDNILCKVARGENITETDYLLIGYYDRCIKENMIKLSEI